MHELRTRPCYQLSSGRLDRSTPTITVPDARATNPQAGSLITGSLSARSMLSLDVHRIAMLSITPNLISLYRFTSVQRIPLLTFP